MLRPPLALFVALTLPGCVIYADTPEPRNAAPYLSYADAGCYRDTYYQDYVWFFEADAEDADGIEDVSMVWAVVYDGFTGERVDDFELYPDQGFTWFSAWVGETTYLYCDQPGYIVDIVAEDTWGAQDLVTIDAQQAW